MNNLRLREFLSRIITAQPAERDCATNIRSPVCPTVR